MSANQPRIILITGASSGIGYQTALAFARQGDKVGATARRLDRLEQLVQEAKGLPGEIMPLAGDVRNAEDMRGAVDEVVERWGKLDVLVANAGLGQRGSIVDSNWDDLDTVLRTNIDGVLHSIRAAVPAMRKAGSGHILTISSVQGVAPTPYSAVYSASKSALNTLARALRVELANDHIWVTNILTGQTHSDFAASRLGRPGRVASRWPTMTPEFVAKRIEQLSTRHRRQVILRPADRLLTFAGEFLPLLMDRILERIYRISP